MKTKTLILVSVILLALTACAPAPNVIVVTQTPDSAATVPESQPITPEQQSDTMPIPESSAPNMYSSYAHMVSCDFVTSLAEFDYFDMLKGEDAAAWLINNEGYTEADARATVDQFAESEYIEKNTNPQLRTIDLSAVEIKLILRPDGTFNEGIEPVPCGMEELYALWAADPAYVFDHYFYYVTVTDGNVVSVEQVYWP